MDDEETVLAGFALKREELASFLFDLDHLVEQHGGVDYSELLENDIDDASADAAIRAAVKADDGEDGYDGPRGSRPAHS